MNDSNQINSPFIKNYSGTNLSKSSQILSNLNINPNISETELT